MLNMESAGCAAATSCLLYGDHFLLFSSMVSSNWIFYLLMEKSEKIMCWQRLFTGTFILVMPLLFISGLWICMYNLLPPFVSKIVLFSYCYFL